MNQIRRQYILLHTDHCQRKFTDNKQQPSHFFSFYNKWEQYQLISSLNNHKYGAFHDLVYNQKQAQWPSKQAFKTDL